MSATQPHAPALSACASLHITENQFFGALLKRQTKSKIFIRLILFHICKYQGIMDLLFNLSINDSKAIDLRIIFKSRWIRTLHE